MRKLLFVAASLVMLGAQATAQIRPQDCRPVFPYVDEVPPPADVVAVQAPPPMVAKRRFAGGMLIIPAVFLAGLVIITRHRDHHNTVSPA